MILRNILLLRIIYGWIWMPRYQIQSSHKIAWYMIQSYLSNTFLKGLPQLIQKMTCNIELGQSNFHKLLYSQIGICLSINLIYCGIFAFAFCKTAPQTQVIWTLCFQLEISYTIEKAQEESAPVTLQITVVISITHKIYQGKLGLVEFVWHWAIYRGIQK